ncbi:MAG: hypothetical protein P1Q69_01300 [Candidatus Thorarchaeota archaeon]|nr:hypothetical protein [Candidatus Thorarchaeota archaeon]
MIVVEDRESNEVRQFLFVDAAVNLGIVQFGTSIRSFDPERLFRYYDLVGNQLYDLASQYSESFRYLPRRAYSYLSKPPILADIYESIPSAVESRWVADFFVSNPLVEIAKKQLPRFQQKNNEETNFRWASQSQYSPRLYGVRDLRQDSKARPGWGCRLDGSSLELSFKGPNRDTLLSCIKSREPIFIHLAEEDDISLLLEWLVFAKDANLPNPELILSVPDHRNLEKSLLRLLEIPRSRLLTSGATIGTLSSIINGLKKHSSSMHWSEKIVFASAYPETQLGDSITEILSFVLSRNLNASPKEVQRILGGNILSIFRPRPSFLEYTVNEDSIVTEGKLGETALLEISRLVRILTTQKLHRIVSIDFMTEDLGGGVDFSSAVLTFEEIKSGKARSVALHTERDGSLRVSGWRESFSESMPFRNASLLRTLIRSSDKGVPLNAPSHLTTFNKSMLNMIGVHDLRGVMSSLHFAIHPEDIASGTMLMCPDDMRAIGVNSGNLVTVLDADSGHWWGAEVGKSNACPSRKLIVSRHDANNLGMTDSTRLDIVKYSEDTPSISHILLTHDDIPGYTDAELATHLHLAVEELKQSIDNQLVGIRSRFVTSSGVELDVASIEPKLQRGQLGLTKDTKFEIIPKIFLSDFNIVLILATGDEMKGKDVSLATPTAAREFLRKWSDNVDELDAFLSRLEHQASRWDISALIALLTIERVKRNRSEGRIGIVFVGNTPTKFTIQKGIESQDYIDLDEDMKSEEVHTSLIYSILDAGELSEGNSNPEGLFRSIAEVLEDFGHERPTQVILCANQIDYPEIESSSFIQAISSNKNYKVDMFGIGSQFNSAKAQSILKTLNSRIIHVEEFSIFTYLGYLHSAIRGLVHG